MFLPSRTTFGRSVQGIGMADELHPARAFRVRAYVESAHL